MVGSLDNLIKTFESLPVSSGIHAKRRFVKISGPLTSFRTVESCVDVPSIGVYSQRQINRQVMITLAGIELVSFFRGTSVSRVYDGFISRLKGLQQACCEVQAVFKSDYSTNSLFFLDAGDYYYVKSPGTNQYLRYVIRRPADSASG